VGVCFGLVLLTCVGLGLVKHRNIWESLAKRKDFWITVDQARQFADQIENEVFFHIDKKGKIGPIKSIDALKAYYTDKDLKTSFHTHPNYGFLPSVADILVASLVLGPDKYDGIISQDVVSMVKPRKSTSLYKACLKLRNLYKKWGTTINTTDEWYNLDTFSQKKVSDMWRKVENDIYESLETSRRDAGVKKYIELHTIDQLQ